MPIEAYQELVARKPIGVKKNTPWKDSELRLFYLATPWRKKAPAGFRNPVQYEFWFREKRAANEILGVFRDRLEKNGIRLPEIALKEETAKIRRKKATITQYGVCVSAANASAIKFFEHVYKLYELNFLRGKPRA